MQKTQTASPSDLQPRKSRSRSGCLQCRLRKKKCPEQKPVCNGCQKLGIVCSWLASDEFAWRIKLGLVQDTTPCRRPIDLIHRNIGPIAGPMYPRDPMSQCFLQTYIGAVSPRLLSGPRELPNPCLHSVLPRAFSDGLVMSAILAVGGSQLCQHQSSTVIEAKTTRYYGQTIQGLKLALVGWMEKSSGDAVIMLLVTVLLCVYEVRICHSICSPNQGQYYSG
jgi:hypothetical protein